MLTLPKFDDITYLSRGSAIQQKAYNTINDSKILYHLRDFHPVVTGSLPIDLFIDGSDIDISCECGDFNAAENILIENFGTARNFSVMRENFSSVPTLLCRFDWQSFSFEVFCQPIAVHAQSAYRHLVIEARILQQYGSEFRDGIVNLKKSGYKTEPAFAKALGLSGDPYQAMLNYEFNP